MKPEQKLAYLRQILQISETRNASIIAAEERYSTDLRQLLDMILGKNGDTTGGESAPAE